MSDKKQPENNRRREAYVLASKNPWLLWRLEAFREGHTPPLLVGELPHEFSRLSYNNHHVEDYNIDPLLQHADRVRKNENKFVRRMFVVVLIGFLLFSAASITLAIKEGSKFRIGFLDAVIPKNEISNPVRID